MKAKIHPQYFEDLKITCSCGNVMLAGSTKKELKTEICSACHPFYTGNQKLIDTAGRVDKFMAKVKKAQKIKEMKEKVVDGEMDEIVHEVEAKEVAEPAEAPVQQALLPDESAPAEEAAAEPEKKAKKNKAPAKKTTAKKTSAKKAK